MKVLARIVDLAHPHRSTRTTVDAAHCGSVSITRLASDPGAGTGRTAVRRTCLLVVLVPVLAVLLAGCGESAADVRPDPAPDAFARVRKAGGLTSQEIRGRDLYRAHCEVCHGAEGRGDGFNAFNINPRPRNLTQVVGPRSVEDLRITVTQGGRARGLSPLMPPYGGTLGPDGVDDVVAFIKTFAPRR